MTVWAPSCLIFSCVNTSVAAGIFKSGVLYLFAVTRTGVNSYTFCAILCIPEIAVKTIAPMIIFPFNFIAFLLSKSNDII